MKLAKRSRVARTALIFIVILVLAFVGIMVWASKVPLIDPAPKGEGSFKQVDSIGKQFRDYYRTTNVSCLPKGYVRLEGVGEEGFDGTWVVYYATASHSKIRGGTIMLMDSTGRIDSYFGHHCSRVDGGELLMSAPGVIRGMFDMGIDGVRESFNKAFKHNKTEQAAGGNGGQGR